MHKSLTNPEDTSKSLATRVMDALDGGVEADAWRSNCKIERWRQWYGYRLKLKRCAIDNIIYFGDETIAWMGISYFACGWICGIASFYIQSHIRYINWVDSWCGADGVYANIDWLGDIHYEPVC